MLTRTHFQLDDVGGVLSWNALNSFLKCLGDDSMTVRAAGKATGWSNTLKTNEILADIYDLLTVIHTDICALGGKKVKPKPYPRPNDKDNNVRHIGSNPLPYDELREWIFRPRR